MGLIVSSMATRDFTGNPLEVPLRVGGEDGNWNRQFGAFSLKGLAGMVGMVGMGMTEAEAISILGGAGQAGATKEQRDAAYVTYYGAGGYYSQEGSVKAAAAEVAYTDSLPAGPPPPMLYGAKVCGAAEMGSTDCVSYNAQAQQANLVLQENARRAWDLKVCEHNALVNPGTNDLPCTRYQGELPVPPVPYTAVKQQAVCVSGECYTPFIGGTPYTVPTGPVAPVAPLTQQQIASYIQNKPNQTVPPKEQPGEVGKKTAVELAAEKLAGGGGAGDGKIFGLDPVMLAVIAGVALLALRK